MRQGLELVGPTPRIAMERSARALSRMERWALKSEAAKALGSRFERVGRCGRYRLGSEVEVWHHPAQSSASYRKVETCGNVWCCPVCSAKVSEKRRKELLAAVAAWTAAGGRVALLTVTFRHGAGDVLGDILDRFLNAYRKMTSWRAYKDWAARAGLVGYVRALEVTHGAHGWHPHGHSLLFLEGDADLEQLERELYPVWAKAIDSVGLPGTSPQAFKLHDGSRAARYVAKEWAREWTLADELTKAMAKRGRNGSRTPWDFLRDSLYDDDEQGAGLFGVYAGAFKGKKQLTWSKGLRDRLGLGVELEDEELAEQAEDTPAQMLASLDAYHWRKVCWAKAQGQLLEVASVGDVDQVVEFVHQLPEPGRRRGQYTESRKQASREALEVLCLKS